MVGRDRVPYLRIPVRTRNVWPGDKLADVVDEGLASCPVALRAGDVLVVAEKIVAIGQGRVVRPEDVEVRRLARVLARFTLRTPAGISLGMPESFELAVREAGVARILAGAAAAAITRPLGIRGVFYRFAGWEVAAIDSPDADALPPSDRCIKLAPHDPDGAARRLADHVSGRAGARVEAAVVDVNDIGAEVLGASPGVDRRLLVSVLRDNPLGQDVQQTPVGIVRAADADSGT
jgi:F420-0:gamma-glutamyl ligase